jgi:PAS domain S-box-containing protein
VPTSETKSTEGAAARRLAAVVASSDDAILTKTPAGVISSWNAAAERLYGYAAHEAIGQPIALVIPSQRRGEEFRILQRVLGGSRVEHYETERVAKDGRTIEVSLTISPVRDATGAIVEASVIARDVTHLRRVERQRARMQAVTAALSQATTADEIVDVVLDRGFAAAQADQALVALRRPGGQGLELLGVRGYSAAIQERLRHWTADARLPLTDALRTGHPVWISDPAEARRRYPDHFDRFELGAGQSLAVLPLVVRHQVIGALGLRFAGARAFDDDDRRFMLTLAQQCAQALERARLFGAEQRARQRAEYLARAGSVLADSLNPKATLEQVARLAVPELADWASVDLLQPGGSITREAIVHADPSKERWARALAERYPLDPDAPHGSARVIRTGEPELTPEIPDEALEAAAVNAEHLEVLRLLGFTSTMVVPLRARGRVLGAIALASAETRHRFDHDDLTMAQGLADRCALALDNALLFSERSFIARTLQEGLLPARVPDIPRVDLAVRYRTSTNEADVGGDFYDVFAAGQGWTFVIGDVVGKGAKAAAITGLARHTLRAAALSVESPAQMLRVLNQAMLDQLSDDDQFCTAVCAHLNAEQLCVVCGGHPLPLILRSDGRVHLAGRAGDLIGVHAEPALHEETSELAAGDTVILYTDGVTDARGPAGPFGEEKLAVVLAMSVALPPAQLVDRIDRAVSAYQGTTTPDDIAILALRLQPPAASSLGG